MEEVTFSFEKLKVYQVARALVKDIYVLQNSFPKEEKYALGDQVRRAATSITANLAEGLNLMPGGQVNDISLN